MSARTVVIGIGNEFRRDDAVGLHVARRVAERLAGPARAGVEVVEAEGDVGALLDVWSGASKAVVVDALASNETPGAVHRLAETDIADARFAAGSTHALGLAEGVRLGRVLGRLPDQLVVYGIEGATFEQGAGLSPAVADAVEVAAKRVLEEIGCTSTQ